jgi:hypothetical protein
MICLVCLSLPSSSSDTPLPPILSPSSKDIVEANPHQLASTVGSLGVGVMDSMAFSPSSRSNLTIDGSQISFGNVSFQPHPPTLILVFANLNREMDLTFRSLSFCVGSLGSLCLSDPIYSGLLASKTIAPILSC